MKLEFFRQLFRKYSNIKFHENPSSRSRVVPCRQTDGPKTDIMQLIVALRNFAKVPTSDCLMYWSHACRRTAENSSVQNTRAYRIVHSKLEQLVDMLEIFTVLDTRMFLYYRSSYSLTRIDCSLK